MSKVKFTAEQIETIQKHMKEAIYMGAAARDKFIADTIGDVYDVELPIPEIISAIADTKTVPVGGHAYYLAPTTITKTVLTLTSDCIVTQTKVTPSTRTELSFTDLISPEFYVCIHDWLKGDHDVLAFYADSIDEAMNRQEAYALIALLSAAAVATSNLYTLSSGATKFDFPALVRMARSVAKYGTKLVLITGANVTTDILLMGYNADKFREYGLSRLNIQQIPVESLSVTINGSPTTVLSADEAYLVAVSDSKNNKPVLFARRKMDSGIAAPDTTVVAKERIVIESGNLMNVGANRKFSKGIVGFEEYGMVMLNNAVVAKFTRS